MQALPIIQLIISILLTVVILFQRSDKGLDGAFGGSDTGGGVKYKKRGAELFMHNATIVLAVLLVISVIIPLLSAN